MTDDEFLRALETCTLEERDFGHAAHVRATYLYLRRFDFIDALDHVRSAIRNFARHLGKPGRYHETMTVAYVSLIQQHLVELGDGGGWEGFARGNPELFQPGLLRHFYPQAQLDSELARRIFLLPRSTPSGCDARG